MWRHKLSAEQSAELVSAARMAVSIDELARRFHVHRETVRRHCWQADFHGLRARGFTDEADAEYWARPRMPMYVYAMGRLWRV